MKNALIAGLILGGLLLFAGCGAARTVAPESSPKAVPYKEIERRADKATGELKATVKDEPAAY